MGLKETADSASTDDQQSGAKCTTVMQSIAARNGNMFLCHHLLVEHRRRRCGSCRSRLLSLPACTCIQALTIIGTYRVYSRGTPW